MPLKKSYGTIDDNHNGVTNSKWYHIDVETLPAKMCNFFLGLKDSSYLPYLILYFTSVGLSITQAGVIAGTRLFGMLIGAPIWGMVDDRWKRPHFLILLLCFISSILMIQMPFVAVRLQPMAFSCLRISDKGANSTSASCLSSTSNDSCLDCAAVSGNARQFWYHLTLSIIIMFFDGALIGLNDSAVMSLIQGSARKLDFGWQRVFGSVGYGVGILASSLLIGLFPNPYPGISKYWSVFLVYALAVVCYAGSAMLLFRKIGTKARAADCSQRLFVTAALKTVAQFNVLFFLLTSLVMGTFLGLTTSFTFKLMADLNSPDLLMGMTFMSGTIGSIILFAFTTRLIHVLGGPMTAIGVAAFAYFLRCIVCGFARSPYVVFGIQVLSCVSFPLFIASAVMYVRMTSPIEILSTMCSLMNGLHFGAGAILANYVGGFVYERLGGPWLFRATAVFNMFWVSMIAIYSLTEHCCRVKRANLESERKALITNDTTSEC